MPTYYFLLFRNQKCSNKYINKINFKPFKVYLYGKYISEFVTLMRYGAEITQNLMRKVYSGKDENKCVVE